MRGRKIGVLNTQPHKGNTIYKELEIKGKPFIDLKNYPKTNLLCFRRWRGQYGWKLLRSGGQSHIANIVYKQGKEGEVFEYVKKKWPKLQSIDLGNIYTALGLGKMSTMKLKGHKHPSMKPNITLRLHPKIIAMIDEMIKSGLYYNTRTGIVRFILHKYFREVYAAKPDMDKERGIHE
jgi:hypothetical protein